MRPLTGSGRAGISSKAKALTRLFPALDEPRFRLLWLGMMPGTLALQMGAVATGYAAFALSGSATVLGGVSVATGLPMLVLSLVGGVVADRASRRAVLIGTQGTLGLSAGIIAVLGLTNHLAVWHLYALGLAQGAAFSFNMPARQAYAAELVAPEQLRSAITLNNAGMSFSRVAGPPVAGGLLAVPAIGIGGVFAAMAAMYGGVLASLFRLPQPAASERPSGRGWSQLVEGLGHVRASPALLALLTVGFVPLLFGLPVQSLLPVFSEEVHGVGAVGLGLMSAAMGVGALAGSLAAAISTGWSLGRLQIALGIGFGLALVGFGLAPAFPVALGMLVLVGFASAGYAALNQTLVMENTAPRFHGRVNSVYLLSFGFMPVATFPEAWMADHIGGPATMVAAGGLVAICVTLAALFVPAYRRLE